jgi:hypothetical protein
MGFAYDSSLLQQYIIEFFLQPNCEIIFDSLKASGTGILLSQSSCLMVQVF